MRNRFISIFFVFPFVFASFATAQTLTYTSKLTGQARTFQAHATRFLVQSKGTSHQAFQKFTAEQGLSVLEYSELLNLGVVEMASGRSHRKKLTPTDGFLIQPLYIDNEGFPQYWVPNEFTIQFKKSVSHSEARKLLKQMGSSIVRKQRTPGYYTVSIPQGQSVVDAVIAANRLESVAFAEPSVIGFDDRAQFETAEEDTPTPVSANDPKYVEQYHLKNTGQFDGKSGADIEAEFAWSLHEGSENVLIAIIDTGVELEHPDLKNKLYPQGEEDWDFSNGPKKIPSDQAGHGTMCAGVAAAESNNQVGVTGVCRKCRILPLKVRLYSGYNQNRADAINYAVEFQKQHPELRVVLSNSWVMGSGEFDAVRRALINAQENNVVSVFAAGNFSRTPISYPARYTTTIAVGASNQCDEFKTKSTCDNKIHWGSNYGPAVDVVAPGTDVVTTKMEGKYDIFSGTSASTPIVAGIAGLLLSIDPTLTSENIRTLIRESAEDQVGPIATDPAGPDKWMGWGRVNAFQAVTRAILRWTLILP